MIDLPESLGAVSAEPRLTRPVAPASTILCIGVSHRTASMNLRERLALSPEIISSVLSRFGCGDDARPADMSELVIVSTCNRLDLYASGGPGAPDALISLVQEQTGVARHELDGAFYRLAGLDAIRHLCRTAAGLDSMVVGEPQILGQISSAFATAVAQRAAGHALSTLFRGAIRAGRRARAETGINRNPATVSSIAVKLVSDVIGDLDAANIVVLGGGEMADLAVAAMHQRGARRICVVTRTPARALRMIDDYGVRVMPLERLEPELCDADVLISSTSAPHHVVTREMVQAAMMLRHARPLVIVDIAVPRDVEPSVRNVEGVRYWDLDDLRQRVDETMKGREAEMPRAEQVVEEEVSNCLADLCQLDVQPLIAELRAQAEAIRAAAIDRTVRGLPTLTPAERDALDTLSRSLVNKLLHQPMVRLRDEAKRGQAAGYVMAVRRLFGLEA
jgi:glutamyl-tRNA reductase